MSWRNRAIKPFTRSALAQQISHFAAEDAIFTCDVGTPTVWAARYLKMNGKRRLIGSFNHGSMANAMPQALGASHAAGPASGCAVRRWRIQHADGRFPLCGANETATENYRF